MIKVALNGGLGNQLFQYAAAKALALKNDTDVFFDLLPLYSKLQVSSLATYRNFELDAFGIHAGHNNAWFKNRFLYPVAKIQFFLNRELNHLKYNYYREKAFSFDADVLQQPDNTYLDGHFQSEKYFKGCEEAIRRELCFRHPLTGKNAAWKERIENSNAVSVHIRRGDYASISKNLKKHGLVSPAYYRQAMQYMVSEFSGASFFIFTDDKAWVQQHFQSVFPFQMVDSNAAEQSFNDLHLMSLCKHHIICNSTFSWWGAWLNSSGYKTVIAPAKWFSDPSINSDDIYPPEWIKL
jgi:hypothetical protein